jgi:hypothetical protein
MFRDILSLALEMSEHERQTVIEFYVISLLFPLLSRRHRNAELVDIVRAGVFDHPWIGCAYRSFWRLSAAD